MVSDSFPTVEMVKPSTLLFIIHIEVCTKVNFKVIV